MVCAAVKPQAGRVRLTLRLAYRYIGSRSEGQGLKPTCFLKEKTSVQLGIHCMIGALITTQLYHSYYS